MSGPIGLFGGSFDPVHNAHLRLGFSALASLKLEGVRWLPNNFPGHREGPRAGAADRLEMLRIALAGEQRFAIDQSELWRSDPTYSVDTLERLRGELGARIPLVFIIGADHLLTLHQWRDWRKLFNLTHFAVAERPGHEITESAMAPEVAAEYSRRASAGTGITADSAGHIVRFPMAPMEISSSSIRRSIAAGKSVADLMPAAVLDYIESKRLYRADT